MTLIEENIQLLNNLSPLTGTPAKLAHRLSRATTELGDGLEAARKAYLTLLRIPYGAWRVRSQDTLIALRDFIALETGCDSEKVQNEFESKASELGQFKDY